MSDHPPSSDEEKTARGGFGRAVREWLRRLGVGRNGETWRETIEDLIEEDEATAESPPPGERALLANLLRFGGLEVSDVMWPRADIAAIDASASLDALFEAVRKKGHSRIPVYRGTLDDVIGFVHIRDAVARMDSKSLFRLVEIVRPILFVAPSMRALDLLAKMRDSRIHMAIIVDEYGGTDGLVTIEDLVEEIVGEIEDEHEADQPPAAIEAPDGSLIADARSPIEAIETRMGVSLTRPAGAEDVDTLGGLVFALLGRVPARGELIAHPQGVEFEILEADPRRIKRVRIRRSRTLTASGSEGA